MSVRIDRESRERLAALPPIIQMAARALVDALDRLINGDCDETAIEQSMAAIDCHSRGKYGSEDLLTYDKAMKVLGIGDRNRLKRLLDANGVKQVTIHNQKVGFRRSDILAVKTKIGNGENAQSL